jgi:hypothetical protein
MGDFHKSCAALHVMKDVGKWRFLRPAALKKAESRPSTRDAVRAKGLETEAIGVECRFMPLFISSQSD